MSLIILTCRNGLHYTQACLHSLLAQTTHPVIVAIDNASSDGTCNWIRSMMSRHHPVCLIAYPQPRSVAEMWNNGLKAAWRMRETKVLVVNNDTELLPETYSRLAEYADSNLDVGMVTCVSRRLKKELEYEEPLTSRPHPDFSCYMIKKRAWELIGGFDEHCEGAYYEDNIAHVEMHRRGIKAVSLSLPFLHHGAATMKEADPVEKKRIQENAARNRAYFYSKYGCYPDSKAYEQLFQ